MKATSPSLPNPNIWEPSFVPLWSSYSAPNPPEMLWLCLQSNCKSFRAFPPALIATIATQAIITSHREGFRSHQPGFPPSLFAPTTYTPYVTQRSTLKYDTYHANLLLKTFPNMLQQHWTSPTPSHTLADHSCLRAWASSSLCPGCSTHAWHALLIQTSAPPGLTQPVRLQCQSPLSLTINLTCSHLSTYHSPNDWVCSPVYLFIALMS